MANVSIRCPQQARDTFDRLARRTGLTRGALFARAVELASAAPSGPSPVVVAGPVAAKLRRLAASRGVDPAHLAAELVGPAVEDLPEPEPAPAFRERLAAWMEAEGYTAARLAAVLGVARSTPGRWLRGLAEPSGRTLEALQALTGGALA